MAEIETILPYELFDYEEAAYMLSKYFIERNFDANTYKSRQHKGGFVAVISRTGFLKNLLGSRTALSVTFSPYIEELGGEDNKITIETKPKQNVALAKEILENSNNNFVEETKIITEHKQEIQKIRKSTRIEIKTGVIQDGAFKELLTYLLIVPAIRKMSDNIRLLSLAKTRSLIICEKLKKV